MSRRKQLAIDRACPTDAVAGSFRRPGSLPLDCAAAFRRSVPGTVVVLVILIGLGFQYGIVHPGRNYL